MDGKALKTLLELLKEKYKREYEEWIKKSSLQSPFQILVSTIISQNTTWKNTREAMRLLTANFKVKPETLAKVRIGDIAKTIKVAGLQDVKARAISEVSKRIVREFKGDLSKLKNLELEVARKWLTATPGIGPKTADVVLAFAFKREVLPIDTHIKRIAIRLGISNSKSYEVVRERLEKIVPPENRLFAHIALILFGREYCKAKNPRCRDCPVKTLCPSRRG